MVNIILVLWLFVLSLIWTPLKTYLFWAVVPTLLAFKSNEKNSKTFVISSRCFQQPTTVVSLNQAKSFMELSITFKKYIHTYMCNKTTPKHPNLFHKTVIREHCNKKVKRKKNTLRMRWHTHDTTLTKVQIFLEIFHPRTRTPHHMCHVVCAIYF